MQSSKQEHVRTILYKIQNLIQKFNHDNIILNDKEKSILVDYKKRLDLFVMDSLTRCLNMKKSADRDQVTTHCAVYFKLNDPSDDKIRNVKKIIITSNKNAGKLETRCRDLFGLIGYEIDSKHFIRKANINRNFLNILNYKFSNLNKSLNFFLEKVNSSWQKSEFGSNGATVFDQWVKSFENIETVNWLELDEKTRNAFRDSALFYFYLTIFYYFIKDFFCFENTELIILDHKNTQFYGLHCEIQLVSKYLNELDQNNDYISVSSDCCVLCNLVLKNLGLKYFGAKNNMCSSRYWKLPKFDQDIYEHQPDQIQVFYEKLSQDLESVHKLLDSKSYQEDNKPYSDEIPYSDEWIDKQFFYWRGLLKKKVKECLSTLKNKSLKDDEIKEVLDNFKIYFSNDMCEYAFSKIQSKRNKKIKLYEKLLNSIKSDPNFKINSIIELYYTKENQARSSGKLENKKRKHDNSEDDDKKKREEIKKLKNI